MAFGLGSTTFAGDGLDSTRQATRRFLRENKIRKMSRIQKY